MKGLFSFGKGRGKRSLITEPLNIVTGALGAGKTLFAIEQADLLVRSGDAAKVYQIGIHDPDVRKLPPLPFPLEEWHLRADAGELKNAVIIVDEFHKLLPPRGLNTRPPPFVEEMAEARRRGVRFLLLTQSGEFDHFLKGTRLNRHFFVQRKAGIGRATILEWTGRFVPNPNENHHAKKEAIVHLWKHPVKQYGDWYKSAESHHFRARIPLRLWVVPLFLAVAGFVAYNAVAKVGDLMDPDSVKLPGAAGLIQSASDMPHQVDPKGKRSIVTTNAGEYLARFEPVVPFMPWSAPAFQERDVLANPELLCIAVGHDGDEGCHCYTEQMTRPAQPVDEAMCKEIARHGVYNPHRPPVGFTEGATAQADGKADSRPRPPAGAVTVSVGADAPGQVSSSPSSESAP